MKIDRKTTRREPMESDRKTARRQPTEETVFQEVHLLRALMDSLPDHIYFKDTAGRFILVNKATARKHHLRSPAQAVGKTDFDFFTEEHARRCYEQEQEILKSGQPLRGIQEMETWLDGRETWVSTTKAPFRDKEGKIVGLVGIGRDITEQKKREALERERNLLRTLIDNVPDSIYFKDAQSRFIAGNTRVAGIMGVKTADDLVGKTDFDFYPNELAEQYFADEQEIIRLGKPLLNREEPLMELETGKKGWLSTTKIPLRDSKGNVIGLVGIGRDITERKQTEETLAKERNLLRTLIDNLPDDIYFKDAESRFIVANMSVANAMGAKTPDELIGKTDFDFYPKEQAAQYYAGEQEMMRSGQPLIAVDLLLEPGTGKSIWVSVTKVPLRDSQGKTVGLVGITRDITALKQTEETLAKERNLLRTLMDSLPDHIYFKDAESRFSLVSKATARKHGLNDPEQMVGKTDFDFFTKEHAQQAYEDEREMMASGQPLLDIEEKETWADGRETWVSTNKMPLPDEKGQIIGTFGISRDITDRKRAEEELQRRIAELATLNEIGHAISSAMQLDQLWELIYHQTYRVMEVSAFYIGLCDPKRKEVNFVIDVLYGEHRREVEKTRRFGKGRTEYIIRTRKPLLIQGNVQKAYRRLGIVSKDKASKAFAGVPLITGDEVIGALAVQNYERDDAYDEHSVGLLSAIANQAAIAIDNARLLDAERRRATQLAVINEVGKKATYILDLNEMLKEVAHSIQSSFKYYNVSIFLVDKDRNESVMRAQAGAFEHSLPGEYRQPLDVGIVGRIVKTGKSRLANDVSKDPYYYKGPLENLLTNSELCVPLKLGDEVIGALSIQSADLNAFDEADTAAMETLSAQIVVAIENARLFEETKRLATTDPLTGIWNRRHLEERLHAEVARARRFRRNLSVLVMDIDNLKLFNDTYGHPVGDKAIHTIARTVVVSCREIDIAGRYGGDEFAVILPETDTSGAAVVAERIIATLEKTAFPAPDGTEIPLGVSIGAASYPSDSDKADRLFSLADAAMYRAKIAGGGQFASLTIGPAEALEDTVASFNVLTGLLTAVDSKDHYTYKHSQDVSRRACALARAMQLSQEELSTLEVLGRLHDIGKIGIPASILRKPGPLNPEEWKVMREHPRLGYMILQQLPQMDIVLQALLHHHERYDGKGYPTGLHDEQIPVFARILALADAYSAMRTDRPYRKAMTTQEALEEVKRNFGKQFDPELAQKFVELIEKGEMD